MEMGELRTLNLMKPKGIGNGKLRTYHIVTCLEDHFNSIYEAMRTYHAGVKLTPWIPKSRMEQEDSTMPRICVAPTLEQCVTAIGVMGIFRRCCGTYEDAFSYTIDGLEIYPVIVLTFEESAYFTPSSKDVPDVGYTKELWITHDAAPVSVELKWLNYASLQIEEISRSDSDNLYVCRSITFVKPERWHIHPWLTGTGNKLDSSNEEYIIGDIPYDVCRSIISVFESAGFNGVSYANYHTVVVFFVYVNGSALDTLTLLRLSVDKRYSITIMNCAREIPNEARKEVMDILFTYSKCGSGERIIYGNMGL